MKLIPLTKGKFTQVDDEDYEYLMQFKWFYSKHPTSDRHGYAVRNVGTFNGKRLKIRMHRELMSTPRHLVVDHIDGNGLNNQRCNLRNCTQKQNMKNRRPTVGCKSKYLGVSIHVIKKQRLDGSVKIKHKWCATIKGEDKQIWLGHHKTEIEAALAYNEAAKKYHGEFANLNIIGNFD